MKKLLFAGTVLLFAVGCTTSKESTSVTKESAEKAAKVVKSPSPDRDARGNYVK